MLIPLGFLASSGGGVDTDYELIETHVLGSAQSSVTFSGLATYASTYKHLQLRLAGRTTASEVISGARVRLGAGSIDTGSNYSTHQLYGYNGSVTSFGEANRTNMYASATSGANASANIFGAIMIDLLDTFSTTKNKTIRSLGGAAAGTGTSAYVSLESGNWRNTGSVTDVQISPNSGNWAIGSRFSLYGIKG